MLIENNHNLVIELFQKYKSEFEEFDYKQTLPEWTELLEQSLLLNQYNEYQFIEFSRILPSAVCRLTQCFALSTFK